ncbi:MAG: 2-(3-amino-3-carboxypropyl)histidine synthase subunit 1/2 [archaeon]
MAKQCMKIMFVEAKAKLDDLRLDRALIALADFEKVCLVATVQFLHLFPQVRSVFERAGKTVLIGKPSLHASKEGQILGCDASAVPEEADAVLYIGTGEFHPLGIAVQKPVFALNPFTGAVERVSEKDIRKMQLQQQARIAKFNEAAVVGILTTTKPGQNEVQRSVTDLKKEIEKLGKKAFVFIGDSFSPQELENFPQIDVWVNTACPRIVDDLKMYKKTIVNANEIFNNN